MHVFVSLIIRKTYILTYCTLCKHATYEKYGYHKLREKLIFAKLPHLVFLLLKVNRHVFGTISFNPKASKPYLDKDSWRLYSLPKSMLFDFRVLTKSNWLASENCFVRFSDILWRPNPSRWKARTGSTSGLKELVWRERET